MGQALTQKQRSFIDNYILCGDGEKAALDAGYKQPRVMASRLLARFQGEIQNRGKALKTGGKSDIDGEMSTITVGGHDEGNAEKFALESDGAGEPSVADMDEIYAFWTRAMRDPEMKMPDRFKASELRAKAYAAYMERRGEKASRSTEETIAALEEMFRELAKDDTQ